MATQTQKGKAFEYACLQSLYRALSENQDVVIEQSNSLENARNFYYSFDAETQNNLNSGADASTRVILQLEPQLQHPLANTPLILGIQEDAQGIAGDVRDIVCLRRQNQWEIGISCKHNHMAVKHSRLSGVLDFVRSWFDIPCSQGYFDEIAPIFNELTRLKRNSILWRNIQNKEERFYMPVLNAFMRELGRISVEYPNTPEKLLYYLLGRSDFYKVISHENNRTTQVQSFNIYGTLNRSSGGIRSIVRIPRLTMPTRFLNINFKPNSRTTINIFCDNGWSISMRIHNAATIVEPSLKLDINLIGVPSNLYTQHEPW